MQHVSESPCLVDLSWQSRKSYVDKELAGGSNHGQSQKNRCQLSFCPKVILNMNKKFFLKGIKRRLIINVGWESIISKKRSPSLSLSIYLYLSLAISQSFCILHKHVELYLHNAWIVYWTKWKSPSHSALCKFLYQRSYEIKTIWRFLVGKPFNFNMIEYL